MRKFSNVILSVLVLSAPLLMSACNDDDSNNPGDGDGDTESGDGDGDTDTESGDGDGDTDTESGDGDTESGDGDGGKSGDGDGDTGSGGNTDSGDGDGDTDSGDGDGDTDSGDGDGDTDTEVIVEPPPECAFEADHGLFCIADCAATDGPGDRVKNSATGAFIDDADWMDGWTNWSREASGVTEEAPLGVTSCIFDEGETCAWLNEDIADDMTLTADKVWGIAGVVHVLEGATLTIEPGTIIKGDSFTKGTLVVSRGGKIKAEGTKEEPIVFTSLAADGDKAKGQWGGLVLLGNASNWKGGNVQIEGLVDDELNQYGAGSVTDGSTDDDDSGSLKYVRLEFGGVELSTDKEINGLTLGSVGSKTDISYVQVNTTLDDGVEFFGGTVDIDHFVVNNAGDDMFDIDQGYRGTLDTIFGRQVVPSTSDPNGFEWDSDKSGGEVGVGLTPVTVVTMKNGTMCGTGKLGKPNYGMVLRENITGTIDNLAFMGFDAGIDARDNFLVGDTSAPKVTMTNSTSWYQIDGIAADESVADNDMGFDEAAWFTDEDSNVDLDD